jgi:hypothetical protein
MRWWRSCGTGACCTPAPDPGRGASGQAPADGTVDERTRAILASLAIAAAWLAWALASDTRRHHGFLVALGLPLALLLLPVTWLAFVLFERGSWLAFAVLGRRDEHAAFIRRVRVRCGFLLLF